MNREIIRSVTSWEVGSDTDWAYETALSFLAAALGQPPSGVTINVAWQDHDLGAYPAVAVEWTDVTPEPRAFIRRVEAALRVFEDAIDWSRIRPSDFQIDADDNEADDGEAEEL